MDKIANNSISSKPMDLMRDLVSDVLDNSKKNPLPAANASTGAADPISNIDPVKLAHQVLGNQRTVVDTVV